VNPILIVLSTFRRTDYAIRTVQAAKRNLRYEGSLAWYVADDGSEAYHVKMITSEIGPDLAGSHSERISYGAGLNRALAFARGLSPLTLWLEDDWELREPLDLTPYANILEAHEAVGMIRLGRWVGGLEKKDEEYDGRTYYNILPTMPYIFSGNPRITHQRFHEAYGEFPEGVQPGETERVFDSYMRFKHPYAVKVLWDPTLGVWSVWNHIGDVKSF
jgi:hypothetical protein